MCRIWKRKHKKTQKAKRNLSLPIKIKTFKNETGA